MEYHPQQTKNMICMQMRDKNMIYRPERNTKLSEAQLRALAAIQ